MNLVASIQSLLNNVLFILLPILIYRMFWLDRDHLLFKQKSIITCLVIPITIILCMSFPLPFTSEFNMDLRYIPYLLGALYIGYPAAIAAFLTIIPYRLFIGGGGVYVTFIVTTILLIIPMFRGYFLNLDRKGRNLFAICISLSICLLTVIGMLIFNAVDYLLLFLYGIVFLSIHILATSLITFLIEDMFHYKKLREEVYLQTDKLSTISELSASVSHEVRNPLTVTKGFLQLLYGNDLSEEKRKNYIDYALSELYRGETIITDFLSLTKSTQKSAPLDVVKELNYVQNIIQPYALMNKVSVQASFVSSTVFVVGVASCFHQCFINIAKNAIEAMPDGGNLQLNVSVDTTHVFIEISDTGVGMTPKEVAKLGTQYYTTKESGTGLGTSLIFRIVATMSGDVDIRSEKGIGTQFFVRFPKVNEKKETATA